MRSEDLLDLDNNISNIYINLIFDNSMPVCDIKVIDIDLINVSYRKEV